MKSPRPIALLARIGLACALATAAACSADAPTPAATSADGLTITVAPLDLPGVTDVSYAITVKNSDQTIVWTRAGLTSSQYGDGQGDLTFVGPCDATKSPNTVELTVESLSSGSDPITDWVSPGTLVRETPCVANTDTAVPFDVTLFRAARQGFFDVAVEFEDVFCSAKLDCENEQGGDLDLLFRPGGPRDATVVVAFACTAGGGSQPTFLYMNDLEITCGDGGRYFIDPTQGPGNGGAYGDVVFGTGFYRGQEQLPGYDKCYWNTAIGMNFTVGSPTCWLHGQATASDHELDNGATPLGFYPSIHWDVQLTDASGQRFCHKHALDTASSGIATQYTDLSQDAYSYMMQCANAPLAEGSTRTICGATSEGNLASMVPSEGGVQIAVGADKSQVYPLPAGYSATGCCANPCCLAP
ncbi:MAG: hypothetical protein KC635_25645 [Myxococcales bacterium]|nr:hypothetical protein [Myxococcales bacterium]